MDIRYENYLNSETKFYEPNLRRRQNTFSINNIPKDWIIKNDEDDYWVYCTPKMAVIPPQGWKIHISTDLKEAQKTLDIVSDILFSMNVEFKYIGNTFDLFQRNFKYADRSGSGKFITIYPTTEYVFLTLLPKLETALKTLSTGAYILSDRRWKSSNIYYRYGGFAEIRNEQGELCIYDENNNLIPDLRKPIFNVPSFVDVPDILLKNDAVRKKNIHNPLKKYHFLGVLHFSNAGGVYLAENKDNQEKVLIKEGRSNAGLDGVGIDGATRIKNEFNVLKKLGSVKEVINVQEEFRDWENEYLVEEYFEGTDLQSWIAQNYCYIPNKHDKKFKKYFKDALLIATELRRIFKDIHSKGIGMGDVSPSNILISQKNGNIQLKIIDMESGGDALENIEPSLRTPGFATDIAKNRIEADLFGILRITETLFLPCAKIQDISLVNELKMDEWIHHYYGNEIFSYIKRMQNSFYHKFPIFDKTWEDLNLKYRNNIQLDKGKEKLLTKLESGLIKNLKPYEENLVNGDIRQFENIKGDITVLAGGFGTILALLRVSLLPKKLNDWIDIYSSKVKMKGMPQGLFNGQAGVAGVLLALGRTERASEILDGIDYNTTKDVTLDSGLAGIGLVFLSDGRFNDSKKIASNIMKKFKESPLVESVDKDFVNGGLIDGWSGAALFMVAMFNTTKDEKYLDFAKILLDFDLNRCQRANDNTIQYKDDEGRLMPYLLGGSAGIAMVTAELNTIMHEDKYDSFLKYASNITKYRCTYDTGLFRGFSGILELDNVLSNYKKMTDGLQGYDRQGKTLLGILDTFSVEQKGMKYMPGEFGLKLSCDLFSGSAGTIIAIDSYYKHESFRWLPLPVQSLKKFFNLA